jgi:tetratricopeptide (TPR) repeat protein
LTDQAKEPQGKADMAQEESKEASVGLQPGARVGKYEVVERIAIGGQAIVYKCQDHVLDRFVALKQISSHLAEDEKFLERFRHEAQILAKLSARQPSIVTIHDILEDEKGLFIVLEYVQGQTIEEILRITDGPIEAKPVLRVLWRLAGALHDVHQAGYIHRDIKPQNILIQEGLKPKITDFGVAASRTGQTSMVLGTTKYMAPELFGSGDVDGRCDIYSLGMIAYEMLVGRPKFKEVFSDVVRDPHSEALRWMKWHGNEDVQAPRLDEVNPGVPAKLADIVEKMMAKDPDQRYQSMEELGRAIKTGFAPRRTAGGAAAPAGEQMDLEDTDIQPALDQQGDQAERKEPPAQPEAPPATAPLTKASMSMRTKLILMGVIAATGIGLGIAMLWKHSSELERGRVNAANLYEDGMEQFNQGKYATAGDTFQRAADKYPTTEGGRKSSVLMHLARAYAALEEADYQQAGRSHEAATGQLAHVARIVSEGSDLHEWTRSKGEDLVNGFRQYEMKTRTFREAMAAAREALKQKEYDRARNDLQIPMGELSSRQKQQLVELLERIDLTALEDIVESSLQAARDALAQAEESISLGRYAEAEQKVADARDALDAAEQELADDERKDEILSSQQRDDYRAQISQLRPRLTEAQRFAASMGQAMLARQNDDTAGELRHLQAARAVRETPKVTQRIRELELRRLRQRGMDLAEQGQTAEAVKALREYLAEKPDDAQAKQTLSDLLAGERWQAMVRAGDEAAANENWPAALEHYTNAAKIRSTDDLREDIRRARFEMHWDQAMRALDQEQFDTAEAELRLCAQYAPNESGRIQAMQETVGRLKRYTVNMEAGREDLANDKYADARDHFRKAKAEAELVKDEAKLTAAQEGEERAFYREHMSKGKRSFSEGQYQQAVAYFKLAQDNAQTDKERSEAREWLKRAETPPEEPE